MRIRLNEQISDEQLLLYGDDDQLVSVTRAEALRMAKARNLDLVEEWERPRTRPQSAVVCRLLHVELPLTWEGSNEAVDLEGGPRYDQALWFHTAHCSGRHFFLGSSHTFPGRLSAWCPTKAVSFRISKSEIVECSAEAQYFLKGYLAGQSGIGDRRELR